MNITSLTKDRKQTNALCVEAKFAITKSKRNNRVHNYHLQLFCKTIRHSAKETDHFDPSPIHLFASNPMLR